MLMTIYAFHDMESAQGIGFYFYLKTGMLSRTIWEIIVDVVITVVLACIISAMVTYAEKKVTFDLFFEALVTYLVFVPIVPINLFHALIFSQADLPGSIDVTTFINKDLLNLSLIIAVFLILKTLINAVKSTNIEDVAESEFSEKTIKNTLKTREFMTEIIVIAIAIIIAAISLFVPEIQKLIFWLTHIVITFLIFRVTKDKKIDSNIYMSFLIITAVFKLIQTTAIY